VQHRSGHVGGARHHAPDICARRLELAVVDGEGVADADGRV